VHPSHASRRLLIALIAVLGLAACRREPAQPAGVIPRDKFIAANVAVRSVPDTAPQTRRDAALRRTGVTDKQLRAWVTAYSRQPEVLSKAWEEIAFKVDSIGGSRPMPVTPAGGPPPPPAAMGAPFPTPRGDSVVTTLPNTDSVLARRRRRGRPPPPPRPGVEKVERVQ
jgi:hypothetical protein